jgi:GH15 family glucan-1,4-alpha-glucosidase
MVSYSSRKIRAYAIAFAAVCSLAAPAWAEPEFVEHVPGNQVYGEPAGVTMREPDAPREAEAVDVWARIGYSFWYTDIAVYYTTDGSEPSGAKGVPSATTSVLTSSAGGIGFVRNEPHSPDNIDWWKGTLPAPTRICGLAVKYKIGAWHSGGGAEILTGTFTYVVKLAWPGKGAPHADHQLGYPAVHFWKEEGVVGNNYINVMLDQNGCIWDVYYPSAGCVQGMSTKNEGYVDGLDTFPPGLPPGARGQMNINQAMAGIRVDGVTYWLSNEEAAGYADVTQSYVTDTNVTQTSQRLVGGGNNILVQQYDYAPKGITFPNDQGGTPNRGLYVKRIILTNNGGSAKTVGVYFYSDFALNGGDVYDGMFTEAARGTMVAYDNTYRQTSSSGEYNPTTFGNYDKNVSIYLAASMKLVGSVGGSGGTPATDFWSDTSTDQGQGWIGMQVALPVGTAKEIDVAFVGGFDNFAGGTGTYAYQMTNAIDWFLAGNMSTVQIDTQNYWVNWLTDGVTIDVPDDAYDQTFKRSLLATALHLDGKNGGIIAGMHNGAYPFIWPRDAVWAAITLARAGHNAEAREIFRFLRDIAYRDMEGWARKGFWKQKYTTDGYTVWGSPQVDETSCYPWGARYLYEVTGDLQFLVDHYNAVYDAAISSSQDSTFDGRLRYEDAANLMYSMSLWEDAFDVFIYSNASVVRGLEDAAAVADILDQSACPGGPGHCNYHNDKALFQGRANAIRGGLDARLDWNGENTDISHLGIAYPFFVYPAGHARAEFAVDRMNGVATDRYGNNHPLVNFSGEFEGLINRYWGDTYWNGGPWFLSTMWYGCYYAARQDVRPGNGDISNHKYRLDLLLDRLGPIGFGAEQIAPSNSLMYPGQSDFILQTAWPNAWESMSFLVDSMMLFLDYTPDAPGNTLRIEPKLPSGWATMTYNNLRLGSHRIDVTSSEAAGACADRFTNRTGNAVSYDTYIRVPAGSTVLGVTQDDWSGCRPVTFSYDATTGRMHVSGAIATGMGSVTTVTARHGVRGDFDGNGAVNQADLLVFVGVLLGEETDCVKRLIADMNGDGKADGEDIQGLVDAALGA